MTKPWRNPEFRSSGLAAEGYIPYHCNAQARRGNTKTIVCIQVKEFGGSQVYDTTSLEPQTPGNAMQYIVEICVNGPRLVDSMAEMRTWLDHQRIEPHGFRHRRDSARIMIHVDFNTEPDAVGFARAFSGRMVGGPAAVLKDAVG
jgi:hypothetical protein